MMTQKVSKTSVKASLFKVRSLVLALVFLFVAQGVWGTDYTWTGSAGDGLWSSESNWDDGSGISVSVYPNSNTDSVTIPTSSSVTLDTDVTINKIDIRNGASLSINSDLTLTTLIADPGASIIVGNGYTLSFTSAFELTSVIKNTSYGTIAVGGKLTNTTVSVPHLALECQTLEVSANLECKSLSVSSTSSLTNTNASGVTYLVATGNDGISFGGNVTVNSAGTPVNGAQFVLGGNVTATSPINLNIASGMLNHVEENTNNHKNWSSNITTVLMNDGCTFGMQDGQSYKTTIEATSGDVYFVGNGTISSIDDSASNAACKLHFGDTESSQNNTFTFGNGITFSKITDIVLDASCKGLKGTVTLSGIKNFCNLSSKLSASSDKIVPTILLAAGATISGNNVNFSTVTCAGAVTIQPDTGKSFSFDSLTCNGNTTISGNNTITDFTASGLGGSNLTIDGTQTITNAAISGNNTNKLSVKGSGSLKLSNPLIANYLDFPEATGPSVTQKPAYASNSTATGGNIPTGWVVVDAEQHVWNGSTNAWETATNWLPQSVPQSTDDVIINAGTPYPLISSDVTVKSITKDSNATITVATGSSLTIADATEFDEKITGQGTGKYIVGSGKTYTVSSGKTLNINIENNGIINVSASLLATSFSGTGTINLNGAGGDTALTATSSTVTSEQNSIVLINTNATLSGKYSLGSFSATNANNMSGKSITFSGAPTITAGNISLSGANSSPLVLTGSGTIIKGNTGNFTAGYLSIGENVSLSNYTNAISDCVPTSDNSDPANWLKVIHNGWNIKNLNTFTYEWSGASSTAWNNTANWNTGFVPQTDCKIVIPSGKARYPVVPGDQDYEGGTLSIAAGASITLGSKNLTLSGTDNSGDIPANPILSNEGTIIFTGDGRIKNSTTAINDTTNGTVQYASTGSGTVTDFSVSDDDYNNLVIQGTGWEISSTGTIKIKGTISIPAGATCKITGSTTIQAGTFDFHRDSNPVTFDVNSSTNVTLTPYDTTNDFVVPLEMYTFNFAGSGITRGRVYLDAGGQNIVFNTEINDGNNNYIPYKMHFKSNVKLNADIQVRNSVYAEKSISGDHTLIFGGNGNIEFTPAPEPYTYNKIKSLKYNNGTLTINGPCSINELTIDGRATTINGDNTITTLKAENNKTTITFEAGKTQTITNLSLKGINASNLLTLTSTGIWSIKCSNMPTTLEYISVKNSNNISIDDSSNIILFTATNSTDEGGNTNWVFPGMEYTWTGADSTNPTKWDESENWLPKSVPGTGAKISIPAGGTPELASDVDISHATATFGTITIAATASLNLNGHTLKSNSIINSGELNLDGQNLTATNITNNGKVLLKGNETVTGTINNGNGTVEYYGDSTLTSFNWKSGEFNNLILLQSVDISDVVKVSGTTQILSDDGTVKLDNANNVFNGTVTVGTSTTDAGTVTLSGKKQNGTAITLADDVYADSLTLNSNVQATNLTVNAPLTLNNSNITTTSVKFTQNVSGTSFTINAATIVDITGGSGTISTTGSQIYNGTVTRNYATTFAANDGTANQTITFKGDVTGNNTLTVNADITIGTDGITLAASQIDCNGDIDSPSKTFKINSPTFNSTKGSDARITANTIELLQDVVFSSVSEFTLAVSKISGSDYKLTNAGTLTLTDGIKIETGIKNNTSKTIKCSGNATFANDVDLSNGTFLHTTGTVYLTAEKKNPTTLSGSSTFANLTINAPGKTIQFADLSEQTVTGNLNLSGSSGDGKKLTLTSTGTWKINCATPQTLDYLSVKNSNNTTSPVVLFIATNSTDEGGNINWAFPGMEYEWQGAAANGSQTSWDNAGNWSPASVPGTGAKISIPAGGTPELASDVDISHTTATFGTITIAATASLNLNGHTLKSNSIINSGELNLDGQNLTATSITNNGKVLLKGNETVTGTINNGNGTVEYYGDSTLTSFNWKSGEFNNLILLQSVDISDVVKVSGTTQILSDDGTVKLDNANNVFNGTVTIGNSTTDAGTITLSGKKQNGTAITLADDVYADSLTLNSNVQATNLTVNAPLTLNNSNITTTGTQTYNGAIVLGASSTFTAKEGTALKDITLNDSITASGDYSILFDSNVITALSSGETIAVPITVNGNLSNTGNTTFNGDINAKGDVTDTGTWNSANDKKLIFNGTNDQTFVNGTSTYTNVEISKSSGKKLTFDGTPTITNLTDTSNAGNITFSAGATITNGAALSTTGTVTVSGIIATTNETFSATKLEVEGDATISTGTGTQSYGTINGKSGTETLELNGSSIAISGNIGGTKKLSSITINGASVLNGSSITTDTVTLKGGNVTGNSTTINGDLIIGTHASGINVSIPLIAKSNVSFYGNNTLTSFTADFSTLTNTTLNKSIIFEKGTLQTFSGKLTLKGIKNEEDYRLVLKSSDEGNTWNIKCESENNHDIKYVEVKDSVNTSSYNLVDYNLVAFESIDFGNNTNWSFPDMFYEWTGADSSNPTLWTEKENWNPKIVPAKGSTIKIKAGKPNYPVLVENLDIYDSYGTDEYGSLIIEENAEFDISNKNLTVFEIRNEGRFRLQGTSTQVISGTMYNGPATPPDAADNSVVEYYGGNTAKLLWDGKSTVDGMQYTNLEITGAANVSEKASVTGTTTINAGTGKTVSLTNTSNVFTGVITLGTASTTSAGNVTLKAADPVTIANNAYADSVSVICPSITIQKVTTNGSSTGTQYYEGAVTAVTGSGIEIVNTGLCTFVGTVAADSLSISGDASITGTVTTTDGTQTYSGALSGGNMQLIADTVTLKDSLTNSGTVQITADTFIDNSNSANLGESAGGTTSVSIIGNLIIHNGTITVNTDVSASEDIIILGTNYSETDGTTGIANEYAYNCNRPESWSEPSYRAALPSIHNAALTVAAGKSIHVGKNFYANGTSLTGSAEWFIDILSNADSQLCFAEAYNSTFSNCTVRKHTGGTSAEEDDANAQIMAEACTISDDCKHFDKTDFVITDTWTTRDNIVYVKFNRAVRNLYGELNLKIANFKYFNAADCDTSYSGFFINADGSTALEDGSEVELVYLKSEDDKNWNTDATGTTPGVANSTDRNGTERTAIPYIDIPRATASASFIVTDRFGKRLKHYSGASRITTVLDKTGPVLVEVRTGQETHETNLAAQAAYDAHNFIEFIYSEPVFFGTHTDTINTVGTQNIQVSNALGIVTSTLTSDTDLTFAGIGVTIENGQMQTRKAGVDSDDATMNAMYRDSTHSLKISLAGYAQNVSSNGTITGSYIMWPGYIEQAVLPQGAVSTTATPASPNTVVTDTDNNQQIMQKTDLTVNNSQQTGTNYGPWDTQEPVFVKVHKHGEDTALDYYEALGNGDGSTLNRIEIHVSDNPSSDESFNKYWLTGYGWTTDPSGTLLSSAADNLVGGSRPFDSLAVSNTTTGGLRYCTILNQESAFKYEVGETDSPTQNFTLIEESASAPFFAGASDTRNNIPLAKDNTYISLSLSDTSLPYKTTFTVSYDSTSSYITDLAGNRLKSVSTMKTLDRTSPDFKISFSPVNQNKIFLLFVKQLRNDIVYNGEDIDESFEEIIPYCFELGTISGSTWTTNSGSALQIDTSVPASIISSKSNSYYTAVELTLNQNATMEDIEETYIRLKPAGTVGTNTYGAQSKDPITGLDNSYVTFIQDVVGNYMPMYQAHALSDFAANMVNPLYAYNDDIEYREENLTYSLYEPESWAVHDWNKEQQNYGTLLAQKPVTVIADVDTSYFADASGDLQYTLRMFYSKNPTAGSESDEYNADIHDSLRLWAPDNSNFANNGLFPAYAAVTNLNYSYVDAVPLDTDLSKGVEFNFTETIAQNFTHGSQISFLFGVFDSSGTTQKSICLNPVLTMSGGSASYNVSAQTPLYIIRLKNPGDITSLDLWSFRVKSVAAQRGNVSIMNNVINADNGEKVVIKVDLKQKGNLNVLVMTLDGNIVDYLQRGEAEEGEHFYSWDGTNRRGKTVARGMYFVRVTGPGIDETRKVLVVK